MNPNDNLTGPVVASPPQAPAQPASPIVPTNSPPPAKRNGKKMVLLILIMLLVAVGAAAAGYYGRGYFNKPKPVVESKVTEVTVPKDAMVTADCVAGRGKQYILAKDIPDGPIYDVVNGKVIAVEYLVGLSDLLAKPESFENLMLQAGTFDHLALMPMDPHAGMAEQHFHAVVYSITADQAKAITCPSGSSSTTTSQMNM